MPNDYIQAQYDKLDAIAARFGQSTGASTELYQRVARCVAALEHGGWEGRGATAFFSEMHGQIYPALTRLIGALEAARSVTLEVAQIMRTAEEEAAGVFGRGQLFGSLSAGGVAGGAGGASFAAGILGGATTVANLLGSLLKGVAADALIGQRYVLRSLVPNLARGNTTVAMLMDMAANNGRGLPLIRFDGPHNGTPFPHINLNPKLTGFPDPHLPISPALLDVAGKGARLLEGAQRVAVPIAVATDVFRLGTAFHNDGNQIGSETKRTAGSVAGGWGGGWAGAWAGAELGAAGGAAVGSIVPVLGTAVGAGVGGFLGGVVGGIGGGLGGSWVGEKLGGLF